MDRNKKAREKALDLLQDEFDRIHTDFNEIVKEANKKKKKRKNKWNC